MTDTESTKRLDGQLTTSRYNTPPMMDEHYKPDQIEA